jgi:hypothetical protein
MRFGLFMVSSCTSIVTKESCKSFVGISILGDGCVRFYKVSFSYMRDVDPTDRS